MIFILFYCVTLVSGNILGLTRSVGVEALVNSTVRLKKVLKGSQVILETDCVETMFMSPFHMPIEFSAPSNTSSRHDHTCVWNFIGTEPCIPTLSCEKLDLDCSTEYLEITDGMYGTQKFCKDKPVNIVAAGEVRDLYVKFVSEAKNTGTVECGVKCGARGTGTPLEKNLAVKTVPTCYCGTKNNDNRIVGGVDAEKNEFPWIVALVEASTRQPFCGGSILNDRIILTAGHCFKGRFLDINNIEILVYAHKLDSTPNLAALGGVKPKPKKYEASVLAELDTGNGTFRFSLEEVFVHPLYVSETNDFDVAAIKLSTPINFSTLKQTHPICLPELPLSYLRTFGHRKATIAGWGLPGVEAAGTPETLQKLDVNVFMPSECKTLYAHRVNRRMMCAGYKEGGKDSCAGDSGGPLQLQDSDKVWYQIGSVSWGDGCAKEANPGVYFRSTESGQWLRHISNQNDAKWCALPEN